MRLTDQALKEFEKLWREDNPNKEISPAELRDLATRTMRLVELVFKPNSAENMGKKNEEQKL